jgi:hypothetical protein
MDVDLLSGCPVRLFEVVVGQRNSTQPKPTLGCDTQNSTFAAYIRLQHKQAINHHPGPEVIHV